MPQSRHTGVIRFGPFEVDLEEGVLRKRGVRVKLQAQPFQVLTALLEKPGTAVTRDELRKRLWPDDTFVDFEHGLNTAVTRLRQALGDSAEKPRYIETLAKRGYRFAAPLEGQTAEITGEAAAPDSRRQTGRVELIIGLAFVAALGAGVVLWSQLRTEKPLKYRITPLTAYAGKETQPAISPDGRQIAFVWSGETGDNSDIYVALIGTGEPLRLTSDPAEEQSPAWSPDGRHIAFYRNSDRPAYYVVPALGGRERKIAEGNVRGRSLGTVLAWSADANSLAISEPLERHGPLHIFTLSIDTGERRQLTYATSPPGDETPSFSSDGRKLAFIRNFETVIIADANGEHAQSLVTAQCVVGLTWSADGREILYCTSHPTGYNLWRIPVTGGNPEPVSQITGGVSFPVASRDGKTLVYSESRPNSNIWRFDLPDPSSEGRDPHFEEKKLVSSTRSQFSPQPSPDGRRIAFASDRSGNREIWICDSNGKNSVQLTFHDGPHVGTPRWSPDGQHIVYDSGSGGNSDIYVISAEGGTPKRLTQDPKKEVTPSWSRDGRWIYFASNRTGNFQISRMSSTGGEAVQLTRNGGLAPVESLDGSFVYYGKRGEPSGVWRVPRDGGVESLAVASAGMWGWRTLTESGIYFIDLNRATDAATLKLALFTGPIRVIRALRPLPSPHENVLAASRDGRKILYQQFDEQAGDLMHVENFR